MWIKTVEKPTSLCWVRLENFFGGLLELCFTQRNCPCASEVVLTASRDELAVLGKGQTQDSIRVLEWLADGFECD
jgi:hypothetical protein